MNQFFAAIAGLILFVTLWGLGRKPRKIEANIATRLGYEDIELTPIELISNKITKTKISHESYSSNKSNWIPPKSKYDQIILTKNLLKLVKSGPEDRLKAINIAHLWKSSTSLKLIRIGLKDSDLRVVRASAIAMESYRGKSKTTLESQITSTPPRNVARMR